MLGSGGSGKERSGVWRSATESNGADWSGVVKIAEDWREVRSSGVARIGWDGVGRSEVKRRRVEKSAQIPTANTRAVRTA